MEIEEPKEFFESVLQSRFKPEKARGVDVTVQVEICGPKGGTWTVEVKEQKMNVRKGSCPNAALKVEMTDANFLDMINEKLSAQKAFFTGKIKFKGDVTLALKLRDAGIL